MRHHPFYCCRKHFSNEIMSRAFTYRDDDDDNDDGGSKNKDDDIKKGGCSAGRDFRELRMC